VLAAAEAVPRLAFGRDDERGRLLAVERAQPLGDASGALQRDRLANDVGDGQLGFDLGDDA
jgi:hypothetical protein